jgi:hypothetical protein
VFLLVELVRPSFSEYANDAIGREYHKLGQRYHPLICSTIVFVCDQSPSRRTIRLVDLYLGLAWLGAMPTKESRCSRSLLDLGIAPGSADTARRADELTLVM